MQLDRPLSEIALIVVVNAITTLLKSIKIKKKKKG